MSLRRFQAIYGSLPTAVPYLWLWIRAAAPINPGFSAKHLLWTLRFLRHTWDSWDELAEAIHVGDYRTAQKWVEIGVAMIVRALPDVRRLQNIPLKVISAS